MKLFCRKYGEGPPLIILHGLYGSSDNWATIAKNLSDIFTVYLPDQRNHGQSPHSDIHDYDSMREDLFELAADLSLKKFFLAGHSMGGKTAISFALKYPEMLNGLLIADISPFISEAHNKVAYSQHKSILEAMLSIDLTGITRRDDAEENLRKKISDEKIRGFVLKNLQRSTKNNFTWKLNASSLLKNLDKIMSGVDRGALYSQSITGFPVIFLKGGDSDYILPSDFGDILKIFPAAEFVIAEKAGHWIHADRPDEVIRNIKRLL
ncbi:MAG: alpha/beta fold hydrolase [Bacteroidales bacterium]|nr:alpha/beta fold hydrolase [Bacteroidales bacterium]